MHGVKSLFFLLILVKMILFHSNGVQMAYATQENFMKKDLQNDVIGKVIHGFKLHRIEEVKEVDGVARIFEHEKTGARLLYLSNADDNKVFSISFRTIPANDTGLPHILEHSVLCGSRKFPTKEPFVDLMKGSVNTFLNAMTFPDKTMYPVASRNDKDFMNLMDVYMDAVLYPNIYKDPYILRQEGWRYEMDEKTKKLVYNGVVFNEMKGVFSSPESMLSRQAFHSLFPNSTYGHESGGLPEVIPNLTQKEFTAFHKKYYHPSNSYIYFYGNGNILKHLQFLNEEYLKDFDRSQTDTRVQLQKPFQRVKTVEEYYSVNPKDPIQEKSYLGLSFVVGRSTDPELYLAMDILENILLETPASPLKRALLDAGIGKDVEGEWEATLNQPIFMIRAKNVDPKKKDKFKLMIEKTLKKLVTQGIDPKLIEATLNRKEFLLREMEVRRYPKGLVYNYKVLDSWLYDGDPLIHLRFEPVLEKIKSQSSKKYFEKLIQKHLLENKHRSLIVLKPKPGLDVKISKQLEQKLEKYQKKIKKSELKKILAETQELKRRQQTPDSPEVQEKIPLLDLKDIDPQAEVLPRKELELGGVRLIHSPVFTNHIAYLGLYFDAETLTQEELPYLAMLSDLLGRVDTKNYRYQDLANEINIHLGGLSYGASPVARKNSMMEVHPKMVVRGKALMSKLPKLFELMEEVMYRSQFTDAKRMKEIIQESKAQMDSSIQMAGNAYASTRVQSYYSKLGKIRDLMGGVSYYEFISDLEKNFDKRFPEFSKQLERIAALVFNRQRLLVNFASTEEELNLKRSEFESFFARIPLKELPLQKFDFKYEAQNEALVIASKVNYVAQGADFIQLGFPYSGKMQVLRSVLSKGYLWNQVRVQGGAYGVRLEITRNGSMSMTSYRDPNLKETYQVYSSLPEHIQKLDLTPREMVKFILGTISDLDQPMTPSEKSEAAMNEYMMGLEQAEKQKTREDILSTKLEDLRGFSKTVEQVLKQHYITVVGGESKIKESSSMFKKITAVIK